MSTKQASVVHILITAYTAISKKIVIVNSRYWNRKELCWRVTTHYDYTHSSFQFQYRLLTMTTFFEIAVYYKREIIVSSL